MKDHENTNKSGAELSRRSLLGSAAALGGLALTSGLGGLARPASAQDGAGWQMPAERPFREIEHEWIEMLDGTRLSARLWLPEGAEETPVPVVFEYIPYRKRDISRGGDNVWGEQLASHGIAFARVDVRGSGESAGVMTDEYSTFEHDDGVAIIEWLSKQDWCSGAVGMRGISWGGINTLQIAARQPDALRAIMVISAMDNRFTGDAHYLGGTMGRTNMEWGHAFKQYMATPPDPEIVGDAWEEMWHERLEATPPILATWSSHQTLDDYWKRGSVGLDLDEIKVPTYVVGGLYEPYSDQIGRMLERLEVPRKGLLGPWLHAYPYSAAPNALDWGYEEIRWWAHWLMDDTTSGIMEEPMLRAFMPYSTRRQALPEPVQGRWIAEDKWPTGRLGRRMYLNESGMSDSPEYGEPLAVPAGEVVGQAHQQWFGETADEQSFDDERSLTFDTAPLEEDLEILGYPSVRVRVTSDQPVAQLGIRVTVVTEEGESWLVDYGIRNLTHRDSFETPEALTPGQSYDVEVPLYFTSFRFPAGSRIRVALSEGLWPLSWPSPQPVQLTVAPGASSLYLPVRPVEAVPAEMPIAEANSTAGPVVAFTPMEPNEDGEIVIVHDTPRYAYPAADIGTELSGAMRQESRIVPGEPNSCVWEDTGFTGFSRGDWNCEVHSSYRLTSDGEQFHLTETLEAIRDGEQVFERTHTHAIPRHLL